MMETRYVTMCILNESCALAVRVLDVWDGVILLAGLRAGPWHFPRTL